MEANDPEFKYDRLTGRLDDGVHLVASPAHDLLDSRRVNPPVGHKFLHRQLGDLASDRIEAGNDYRAGRVINHDLDPGQSLESADIATLATDDPALQLIRRQAYNRDRCLGCV